MEEKVLEILRQVLNVDTVNLGSSQENCPQWDSLHHLNLVVEIEDAFDVSFEPEEIAAMKSVAAIITYLSKK